MNVTAARQCGSGFIHIEARAIISQATVNAAELWFKSESRRRRYNAAFLSVAASDIEKQLGIEGMCPRVGGVQHVEST